MSTIILASGVGERRRARKLYDATLDRSWEYDQVGRLMHAYSGEEARAHVGRGEWGSPTGPYAHSYEYDVWGNMVRRVGWGGWNAAYEASYVGNRRVGFEYDGAGDVVDDGRQQYGYDAVWRQVRAQGSGYRLEQQYDGDGLRVKKNDNGEVVYYIRSSVLGGKW